MTDIKEISIRWLYEDFNRILELKPIKKKS
jgi:hypothetical protein